MVAQGLSKWITKGPPKVQNIEMRLIGVLLRELGDPDWQVFEDFEVGVRIGVGIDMPRTPMIFGEKAGGT